MRKFFAAVTTVCASLAGDALADCPDGGASGGDPYPSAQICFVKEPFLPELRGLAYSPPTCDTAEQVDEEVKTLIQNSVKLAPKGVEVHLCKLSNIFISRENWGWGLWEDPFQDPAGRTYVALPERPISLAYTVQQIENVITSRLFEGTIGGNYTVNDSNQLGVLSLLAHELGHILWYLPSEETKLKCFRDKLVIAWKQVGSATNPLERPWVRFAEEISEPKTDATNPDIPSVRAIKADVNLGNIAQAQAKFRKTMISGSGRFPSFFGAHSPQETFVEAFKMLTLENAEVTPKFQLAFGWTPLTANKFQLVPVGGTPPVGVQLLSWLKECKITNMVTGAP